MPSHLRRAALAAAVLGGTAPALLAQGAAPYTLMIQQHGAEIGREQITARPEQRGLPGSTIGSVARYPAVRPRVQLSLTLERAPGGALTAAQFDRQTPEHAWRTYAAVTGRRLTVRSATEGRESAREFPAGPTTVVLDDSLYAPWLAVADLASDSAIELRAVWPRTGRSGAITVRRRATADGGRAVEVTGSVSATVEVTRDDRLLRVILPGRDVSAGPLPQ